MTDIFKTSPTANSLTVQPDTTTPHDQYAPPAHFKELRAALAQAMVPDGAGQDMLRRQMMTMDAIFDDVLRAYTTSPYKAMGATQVDRLALMMRLQSRCTDSARALSAMDYMEHLQQSAQKSNVPSRPPACGHDDTVGGTPTQNDEQTEGMEK